MKTENEKSAADEPTKEPAFAPARVFKRATLKKLKSLEEDD